jgi:hypothetical protein
MECRSVMGATKGAKRHVGFGVGVPCERRSLQHRALTGCLKQTWSAPQTESGGGGFVATAAVIVIVVIGAVLQRETAAHTCGGLGAQWGGGRAAGCGSGGAHSRLAPQLTPPVVSMCYNR